ncbi:MAG: enoyl-CoA hydratase-related protein, partial [Elusimicrobiota bacterium]
MNNSVKFKVEQNVGFIEFDQPDSKVNVLNTRTMIEIENILGQIEKEQNLKGVIITSAKENIFIAGADIKEIENITDVSEGENKSITGQKIFNKLEGLRIPTIAVINGAALGGGLELAMACKYRVGTFNEKIKLGLPEVQLGILPGFGGTYRLPKLVGLKKSLDMILTGKTVSSSAGLKAGLLDRLYPEKILISETLNFLNEIIEKKVAVRK